MCLSKAVIPVKDFQLIVDLGKSPKVVRTLIYRIYSYFFTHASRILISVTKYLYFSQLKFMSLKP